MDIVLMKGEWKCASQVSGKQYAAPLGIVMMQGWSVCNWVMLDKVAITHVPLCNTVKGVCKIYRYIQVQRFLPLDHLDLALVLYWSMWGAAELKWY